VEEIPRQTDSGGARIEARFLVRIRIGSFGAGYDEQYSTRVEEFNTSLHMNNLPSD
jgi:hypothetical protein